MPNFNEIWVFAPDFLHTFPTQNVTEIRPVGGHVEISRHSDQRTDMTKVIGDFRDYANAPNNWS